MFEINDKVLLFSFDHTKDTKNTIYYQVLNKTTGLFGKEILFTSFENEQEYYDDGMNKFKVFQSANKKNLFIVYSQDQDKRDFSKFKHNKKNADFLAFNIIVLNENLEKVFEKGNV